MWWQLIRGQRFGEERHLGLTSVLLCESGTQSPPQIQTESEPRLHAQCTDMIYVCVKVQAVCVFNQERLGCKGSGPHLVGVEKG